MIKAYSRKHKTVEALRSGDGRTNERATGAQLDRQASGKNELRARDTHGGSQFQTRLPHDSHPRRLSVLNKTAARETTPRRLNFKQGRRTIDTRGGLQL
jgi:hypothetical protein